MSTASKRNGSPARSDVSPPRPPLAFRVSIVGHRPDRLESDKVPKLREVLHDVLQAVKDETYAVKESHRQFYDCGQVTLRAITPLAEGSDRVFGEEALSLGYEIGCVTPFALAEFERDFEPGRALEEDSLERFRAILDRARKETALSVFEMDGSRDDEGAAYGAAGRVVLNQSDLMVVVWDGYRQGKRGGTEETFDEAKRRGVTIVWIDARNPRTWQLIDAAAPSFTAPAGQRVTPDGSGTLEKVRTWVRESLDVPHAASGGANREDPKSNLLRFYDERQPKRSFAIVWNVFRNLFGDSKVRTVSLAVAPFEEDTKADWPADRSTPIGCVVDFLRPYYAWPDKLAVLYSNRYRSAFVTAFALAAIAVGLALLPFGVKKEESAFEITLIVMELATITAILALVYAGQRGRWHERWIDYRLAAELVRHLRLVAPLGGGRPFPQVPAHWTTYGHPSSTWMTWYVRAVERAMGLPAAAVEKAYLDTYLLELRELIAGRGGQIAYHNVTRRRAHNIESRLHFFGIGFLVLTFVACAMHLLHGSSESMQHAGRDLPHWLAFIAHLVPARVLTFACGFFPAIGAAMQGVVNQGEFLRIAKHSESMEIHLENLLQRVDGLRAEIDASPVSPSSQYSTQAIALAGDAARLLVAEVLDWRVVFLDHPLNPPA